MQLMLAMTGLRTWVLTVASPVTSALPLVELSRYTACPAIPLSRYPAIPLSRYPAIPLSRYTAIPLSRYTAIPLSRYPKSLVDLYF